MPSESVLIIGGGVSGLSTAFYLGQAGLRSTLIEKTHRLGGLIKTDHIQGCDLEAGPDSFIATKTSVADLATDLGGGLTEKIIGSQDAARRIFVVRKGRLMPMPKGMSMMVPGEWAPVLQSPLLSLPTKWRLLRETFARPLTRSSDFSVGDLVRSHFGNEVLEYLTEPLLSGVYGGDSATLSARSVLPRFVGFEEKYGSLIRGVRKTKGVNQSDRPGSLFLSFEEGMQTLTDSLARAVQRHSAIIHGEAFKVEKTESGWRVRLGTESISARHIVIACPAWSAAGLLNQSAVAVASELQAIPYSCSLLVMLVFNKAELAHSLDGFGFLAPKAEQVTIAAATWVNTKWPSRIAEGFAALRAFIVGAKAEEMAQASTEHVVDAVCKDFSRLMSIRAKPVFHTIHSWPKSMPQYVVGHEARIQRLTSALSEQPGLYLVGNYLDGVGIPDCIRNAKRVAKQIEACCV